MSTSPKLSRLSLCCGQPTQLIIGNIEEKDWYVCRHCGNECSLIKEDIIPAVPRSLCCTAKLAIAGTRCDIKQDVCSKCGKICSRIYCDVENLDSEPPDSPI